MDAPDEDTSVTEEPLYVKGSKIWHQLSIPVCWDNPGAGSATERGWVQNKIATTWSAVSYVQFTGWGTCTQPFQSGIHIFINDEGPHTTALGRDLDGVFGGMVLNFDFNNWSTSCKSTKQFCIEAIAAHEFGHALGFAHEQNRPDTPASCTDAPQGDNGDTTVGSWDANSIMNYCAPDWNNNGDLSSGDIKGVRQYYGSPTFAGNRKAAVAWPSFKTYFFNGSQYTRYDYFMDRTDGGFPANITTFWNNWPATWTDGIDAGIVWNNGKAYFFRGSEYIRYDVANDSVDAGYPKPIAGNWPGLFTSNIDYAFTYPNGWAYFFKGKQYQRVAMDHSVDQTMPIVGWWAGVPF